MIQAQEFLSTVAKEKSFVFVVVNRFDDIRDKNRCKTKIMQQIEAVLPQTFEHSSDLVHFVSARVYLEGLVKGETSEMDESFKHLEASLSDFTLEKRTRSKLSPARTFVVNLLNDIEAIAKHNLNLAGCEKECCTKEIEHNVPRFEEIVKNQQEFSSRAEIIVEESANRIKTLSETSMFEYLNDLEKMLVEIPWYHPIGSLLIYVTLGMVL